MELFGISFLFYFLPLFLGVYYITSEKNKPLTILLGSVIFYVLQDGIELWQVAVALMIVVVTFFIGLGMKKEKKCSPVHIQCRCSMLTWGWNWINTIF